MRLRPTELGLKGVLLLCALDVAFLATAYSNLFFLLLVFLVALGGLGLVWTAANLRGLTVELLEVPPAAAEAARPVRLRIRQRRPRPVFDVAVFATTDLGCHEVAWLPTVAGSQTVVGQLPPLPRGLQTLQRLELRTRYPFGLFQATRHLPATGEVLTTPRLGPPLGAGAAADDGDGDRTVPPPLGQRTNAVAGLRPHRNGDPLGDVHWRATARRGAPIVKEREREADDLLLVVFDRRQPPAAFARALERLAGTAAASAAGGQPLRVVSQGADLAIDHRPAEQLAFARWLATVDPLAADAPPPPAMPGGRPLPTPAEVGHG